MKADVKEIIKLGSILLIVSVISAVLLSIADGLTQGPIMAQRETASRLARQAVLKEATKFEKLDATLMDLMKENQPRLVDVHIGYAGTEQVGLVIKTTPGGYGGDIEVTTGVNMDGKISGVRIGTHLETPGLGAKAKEDPEFYEQFNGMNARKTINVSKVKRDENQIIAISGATITSDAVTEGVNLAANVYIKLLE